MDDAGGVHLFRTGERVAEVEALAAHVSGGVVGRVSREVNGGEVSGRVGVEGVLGDLNRAARVTRVPGKAAVWGFTWDTEDNRSRRWWPQGITTSADHGDAELLEGRSVVVTSAYSHDIGGLNKGSRLSFVDVSDRSRVRYRHVLLVEPFLDDEGRVDVRPIKIHAGGIVWHGPYLHVAGTTRGLYSFRLDDIVRVPTTDDASRLRLLDDGGVDGFGYKYLLPVRFTYDAFAADGLEKMRYSFLSLDRSTSPHHLVAGEYGRGDQTTRLMRYEIDPSTSLLRTDPEGASRPVVLEAGGVPGMQGAAVVGGTFYVTTSNGRFGRGSLWVGRPGALTSVGRVLPVGPEDIAYWPSTDQLWSLTEHPGRRYVYAMDRSSFGG